MSENLFVKVPHAVIDHADLDLQELMVYIVLLRYRNPKTGKCYPGLQAIADAGRMSRKTASRTVARLEDKGLITVKRAKAVGSMTNESNTYTVGLLPEDPAKYFGKSAKGQRVPKRSLSRDSESLPSSNNEQGRDSESLGRDSESRGRDSESLRVGTPSLTKKNNLRRSMKKNNEEDMTHVFKENTSNVSFMPLDHGRATEKQVQYIRDLSIQLNYGSGLGLPTEQHLDRWRKLTQDEATAQIRNYLKALGRPDEIYYPQYGDPEFEALSDAGKEFAESAGDPSSVFEYGFGLKENSA